MKRFFALLISTIITLSAANIPKDEQTLKKMIGRMLIVGFEDESIDKNSKITSHLQNYELGGVILFDRFYNDRNKTKNISSPEQLKALTSSLKSFSKKPLLSWPC